MPDERRDLVLAELRSMKDVGELRDAEMDHARADELLLQLLADPEIREAFDEIRKWYA